MDKVSKFVRKLSNDEAYRVLEIVERVRRNELDGLNVVKLKGRNGEYRVRIGSIRIQFKKFAMFNLITEIEFRGDHTY